MSGSTLQFSGHGIRTDNDMRKVDDVLPSRNTTEKRGAFWDSLEFFDDPLTTELAATKCSKLTKREVSSVNVRKMCNDIIDTIMLRQNPVIPGGRRMRFSLYLSSQLMYGVVEIHKKHCEFLLGDAGAFFTRLRIAVADLEDINLRPFSRLDMVTDTDFAAISGRNQIGFDPDFGCFKQDDIDILSTLNFPDVEMFSMQSSMVITGSPFGSPVQQRMSILATPEKAKGRSKQEDRVLLHTVSSPEEITMKEVDLKIPEIEVPGVADLPEFDIQQMETILEEAAGLEPVKEIDLIMSPIIQPSVSDDISSKHMLSPQEKTPHQRPDTDMPPRHLALQLSPGITPAVTTDADTWPSRRIRPSLTMELEPVTPSPLRRRRRKIFADREIQITGTKLRENMKTGHDTCHPFVLQDAKGSSVTELFNTPARPELRHTPLSSLWKKNAKYGICETESDIAIPVWTVPELGAEEQGRGKRRNLSPPRLEMSPVVQMQKEVSPEHQRISSPELQLPQMLIEETIQEMPSIELVPDMSSIELAREKSLSMERSRAETPANIQIHESSNASDTDESLSRRSKRRRSSSRGSGLSGDLSDLAPQVSMTNLPVVPEEAEYHISPVKIPRVEEVPVSVEDRLVRIITRKLKNTKWTTFHNICPPAVTTRIHAARMFSSLLDLCARDIIQLKQKTPFEDIYISEGRNM